MTSSYFNIWICCFWMWTQALAGVCRGCGLFDMSLVYEPAVLISLIYSWVADLSWKRGCCAAGSRPSQASWWRTPYAPVDGNGGGSGFYLQRAAFKQAFKSFLSRNFIYWNFFAFSAVLNFFMSDLIPKSCYLILCKWGKQKNFPLK